MCARRVAEAGEALSRESILTKARQLYVSKGYDNVTMHSVSKELGYTHGALYYHYGGKAELFRAIIEEDFKLLLKRQKEILQEPGTSEMALLQSLMLDFVRFGLDHPHQYEIMFMLRQPELRHYSQVKHQQCLELFSAAVQRVLKGSKPMDGEQPNLASSMFMSIHGFISHHIQYGQSFDEMRVYAQEYIDFLCKGIGLKEGNSST